MNLQPSRTHAHARGKRGRKEEEKRREEGEWGRREETGGNHGVSGLVIRHNYPELPQIPLLMLTESFKTAWEEWVQYRIEVGRKMRWPVTFQCFSKAMQKCEQWGPERAVAAIDYSIEMAYRGIFEPRQFDRPDRPSRPATSTSDFPENPDADPKKQYYGPANGRPLSELIANQAKNR
jgi:hypothetical protein